MFSGLRLALLLSVSGCITLERGEPLEAMSDASDAASQVDLGEVNGGADVDADVAGDAPRACPACPVSDGCSDWVCDPSSGQCQMTNVQPDGTPCGATVVGGCGRSSGQSSCQAGVCPPGRGGAPLPVECSQDLDCDAASACQQARCNAACSCDYLPIEGEGCCDPDGACAECFSCAANSNTCVPIPDCVGWCDVDSDCDDEDPCTNDQCDPSTGECTHFPGPCPGPFECKSAGVVTAAVAAAAAPGPAKVRGLAAQGLMNADCAPIDCPAEEQVGCTSPIHLASQGVELGTLLAQAGPDPWSCDKSCGPTACDPVVAGTEYWMGGHLMSVGQAGVDPGGGPASVLQVGHWCIAISELGLGGSYQGVLTLSDGGTQLVEEVTAVVAVAPSEPATITVTGATLEHTVSGTATLVPAQGEVSATLQFQTKMIPVTAVAGASLTLTSDQNTLSGVFYSVTGTLFDGGSLTLTKIAAPPSP